MNLFEMAGFASPIAGAVARAIVGRKTGSAGFAIGIPAGLAIGLGCYFSLLGLSVVVLKLSGFGRDERDTALKGIAGLLTILAMWAAPPLSAVVTAFVMRVIIRHGAL